MEWTLFSEGYDVNAQEFLKGWGGGVNPPIPLQVPHELVCPADRPVGLSQVGARAELSKAFLEKSQNVLCDVKCGV